jgi:hypothetical protein
MPETINVQFTDDTEATIKGYFGAPQDASEYPNMGAIERSDARWRAFYESLPSLISEDLPSPTA